MDISTLPVGPVGAGGILCFVILMILKGTLIPRSVHEDRMRDKDQQIEHLTKTNDQLTAQNEALMQVGYTAEKVLKSLREAADKAEEDHREVASS